jgi:hypothetical protein
MPVFVRVKPKENLLKSIRLFLFDHLLCRMICEDFVRLLLLLELLFCLHIHLLIVCLKSCFVQVLV